MTWNKIHRISLHKLNSASPYFDMLCLVPWLRSGNIRARQSCNCLWMSLCVFLCVLALDKMQHGSCAQRAACLVNRSANTALCALLVFLVMGTSIWWTFSLRCRENDDFSHSICLPPPFPLIIPSFSPLALSPSYSHCRYHRCCSQILSQYGCWTWEEMIPTGWQEVKMRKQSCGVQIQRVEAGAD